MVFLIPLTSTLHGLLQRGKALGALLVAAPFVKVEIRLTLGAEVFAEAGLTVVYPASWWRERESERERER